MSLSINTNYTITPSIATTTKDKSKNNDEEKVEEEKKRKKQIISQKEGAYYCTYLVDENGKKFLLNKVPDLTSDQNVFNENNKSSKKKLFGNKNISKTTLTALEYRQQLHTKNNHEKTLYDLMNILKATN